MRNTLCIQPLVNKLILCRRCLEQLHGIKFKKFEAKQNEKFKKTCVIALVSSLNLEINETISVFDCQIDKIIYQVEENMSNEIINKSLTNIFIAKSNEQYSLFLINPLDMKIFAYVDELSMYFPNPVDPKWNLLWEIPSGQEIYYDTQFGVQVKDLLTYYRLYVDECSIDSNDSSSSKCEQRNPK